MAERRPCQLILLGFHSMVRECQLVVRASTDGVGYYIGGGSSPKLGHVD